MQPMNDFNTVELLDDVDNLLFLCDRLQGRLNQVTTYIDDLKQLWITKRRSIESDSNVSPLVAQKASKCNKVLLNVAEKLATVELQTESLHHLQSTMTNLNGTKKPETSPSITSLNAPSASRSSSTVQMNNFKQELTDSTFASQRDPFPSMTRSFADQRITLPPQTPIHVSPKPVMSAFRTRETPMSMNDPSTTKSSIDQLQLQQSSAFHRPVSTTSQPYSSQNQVNPSPVALITPPVNNYLNTQKTMQNGAMSNGLTINRPPVPSETLGGSKIGMNLTGGKVRVQMQVIPPGTIWKNADIPITDHPSAFFVCNQDPRVTEQFNLMSIEMNTHYNKLGNAAVPLQDAAIGDFCVARFTEDNFWYRARVVLKRDDSILIVFIDYGNSESKAVNEIYPLQESLTRLPAMAVACTLADSFPNNQNFWTPEETEIFNRLVKNRIVEVHFLQGSDRYWPLHFVQIILDGKSITQYPQLASCISPARNEQIAMHFNDKLTSMEYILYNVAVADSDIYTGSMYINTDYSS